jgi:AbrB family looped-hinge helix DNA binding protein
MYTSTITSKGTVTIPAKLRKLNNLKPKDKISLSAQDNKIVIERIPNISELAGIFTNPKVKPITQKEMDKLTEQMLSEGWQTS